MIIRLKRLAKKILKIFFPKKDYLNKGERYDPNIANYYDPCHVSRYEFAMKQINLSQYVIDIACGTGWGSNMLKEKCKAVRGVDISSDAIKFAIKNYTGKNIDFIESDFFEYSEVADVIVSFETLEHIKARSFEVILSKLISLSRGLIIGSVPFEEIAGKNPFHVSFQLNESSFDPIKDQGKLVFLYQDSSGFIHENRDSVKPQNLIFVFSRSNDN